MQLCTDEILNSTSEAALVLNTDKRVIFVNPALKRLPFQDGSDRVDIEDLLEVLSESFLLPSHAALLDRAMFNKEKVVNYETVIRDVSGTAIPVHIHVNLLVDENEDVIGAMELIQDLSLSPIKGPEKQSRVVSHRPMVGRSKKMLEVLDLVASAAASQATVLLEGESGTGKELIARAVHQMGPRREKAFIAVNCASLPDELLESELFGHIKGAFTTAIYDRPGRFELADQARSFWMRLGT